MSAKAFWVRRPSGPCSCGRPAEYGDLCYHCKEDELQMRYLREWEERKEARRLRWAKRLLWLEKITFLDILMLAVFLWGAANLYLIYTDEFLRWIGAY